VLPILDVSIVRPSAPLRFSLVIFPVNDSLTFATKGCDTSACRAISRSLHWLHLSSSSSVFTDMYALAGFEPATSGIAARCSVQLSYKRRKRAYSLCFGKVRPELNILRVDL